MRIALVAAVLLFARADAQNVGWDLRIPERVELVPGASGTLPITINVDRGRTISKDAGLTIDLAPEGGVSVKKRRLGRGDAVDPEADAPRFAVPLRADAAGDFAVKVHVRFWLCGSKVCRPIEARRSVAVAVTTPTPPPAPPVDAGIDAPRPDAGRRKHK
ncbi:MAG TPA: hypothetical protein VFV99_26155 [Kofleriaceae bacterium]|nr:hypothetical protein [Kofleriaceae bacterium]